MSASVLFDAPGPRARRTQRIVAAVLLLAALALGAWVLTTFAAKGQLDPAKWRPLLWTDVWSEYLLPGILGTLEAAALSILTAGVIGLLLGVGRLSHVAPVRWLASTVVELFRAVPVLVMMLFAYALYLKMGWFGGQESLAGVVTGLTVYNGAVIAELLRSGVENLPTGQREAGLSIGLTQGQTLRSVLLPQALTAMLPSLVSQLVVVLKDTALGYVILYEELLRKADQIGSWQGNVVPAIIFVALIYIAMNFSLTSLAHLVERRLRRSGHTAGLAPQATPEEIEAHSTDALEGSVAR
ncbi:amino acid ABC transporter permease [Arsenicicoccus dermatophilus]|uniref:amino acid ABC transporter permease n=1 Tax=Arsenicicoccus dermatophilus TaxID=1076331 RepID=UPI0039171B98